MPVINLVTFRAPAMIPSLVHESGTGGDPVILVPQSFTLAAEKAILTRRPSRGILGVKIFSPSSLIREIHECAGKGSAKEITSDGRTMLISRLLLDLEDDLRFYGKSVHQPGLPKRIADQIDEFRNAGLEPSQLPGLADTASTAGKLEDIAAVWSAYNNWRGEKYFDSSDAWLRALDRLPDSHILDGAHLLIYGFDSITANILQLVLKANHLAAAVTIGLICDDQSGDSAIFRSVLKSIARFRRNENLQILQRTFEVDSKKDPGIRYVESHLFAVGRKADPVPDLKAVYQYYGRSSCQECVYIAQTLIDWRRAGLAWSDMAVAVCEPETLPRLLPQVLRAAGIPCTVRVAQSVLTTDLAVFFQSVILSVCNGWEQADVMKVFRSGFMGLTVEEIMDLENYVFEHGITRAKWLKPFIPKDEEDRTTLRLEEIRSSAMGRLTALKAQLTDRHCGGRRAAELLYQFLLDRGVYDQLLAREQAFLSGGNPALVDLNRQVWSAVLDILDQLAAFVGDHHLSLRDLSAMVTSSLAAHQVKSLPQSADTVIVAPPSMFISDSLRGMVVAGFQQIAAPGAVGLLSDRERATLEKRQINLGFNKEDLASRAKQDVYQAISVADERLLLSCSASRPDGGVLYPSQQFKSLSEILRKQYPDHVSGGLQQDHLKPFSPRFSLEILATKLREARDFSESFLTGEDPESAAWREALNWLFHDPAWHRQTQHILDSLHVVRQTPGIRPDQAEQLYPASFSPSFAETAALCLCQNWVQRGLCLQPRREFSFAMDQQGAFTHEIMRQYFELAVSDPAWPNLDAEKVNRILNAILRRETSSWREGPLGADTFHRYQGASVIRNIRTACEILTLAAGARPHFVPFAMEAGFGSYGDRKFPAVSLVTPAGRPVTLSGIIDRVAILVLPDGRRFFLIVDYKSSNKEMRCSSMNAGLELQLPIYLKAAGQGLSGYTPAGGVFQPIREIVVESSSPEKISGEVQKEARSRGIVLDEEDVQLAMQPLKTSASASSDILPAVAREGMREMIDRAMTTAGRLIDLQFSGDTTPSPLQEGDRSPCEFCFIQKSCSRDPRLPGGKPRLLTR